jgi:hypothetical protein
LALWRREYHFISRVTVKINSRPFRIGGAKVAQGREVITHVLASEAQALSALLAEDSSVCCVRWAASIVKCTLVSITPGPSVRSERSITCSARGPLADRAILVMRLPSCTHDGDGGRTAQLLRSLGFQDPLRERSLDAFVAKSRDCDSSRGRRSRSASHEGSEGGTRRVPQPAGETLVEHQHSIIRR